MNMFLIVYVIRNLEEIRKVMISVPVKVKIPYVSLFDMLRNETALR